MKQKKRIIRLMGTVIELLIQHERPTLILDEVVYRLMEYEHRFSANKQTSELMAVNQNAGIRQVIVKPELFELIKIGKDHSCAKDSNLNIAIGPLVQTWRIGFDDAKVPSDKEIKELLNITNPNKILLNEMEQSVFLEEKGMSIDLGCLAKGFIADRIADYLKSQQVASAFINLGGNVIVFGPANNHPDLYWRIGIQNPTKERNQSIITLKVRNQSVVTSGIYERSLTKYSQTYHHILDPHTGYPLKTDVASLTIVSEKSCEGEVWTTRLFGKTSYEIIDKVNQLEGMEALIITQTGQIIYSNELEKSIMK